MVRQDLVGEEDPLFAHRETSAKERLVSILSNRIIHSSPMNFLPTDRRAVCFTECVWEGLTSLAEGYSPYGVVFSKRLIFDLGGGPALYLRGDLLGAIGARIPEEVHAFIAPFDPEATLRAGVRLDWLQEKRVAPSKFSRVRIRTRRIRTRGIDRRRYGNSSPDRSPAVTRKQSDPDGGLPEHQTSVERPLEMATFSRAIYPIAQFVRWDEQKKLILQPKFQRRAAWEGAARSYLIDTIVRELPMPKIYLRRIVSPKTQLTAYEVVDGQQRLRAILDFYAGNLLLSRRHNADLGDVNFSMLPDSVRRTFLEYEISAEVMLKASDPEVWAMFERLNTYTLTLNRQERLNAKWFGYFKQTAYKLAAEESALEAWRHLKVFSNQQIARMKEVELTSDVVVAIVEGISDITAIANAYKNYDAEFSNRNEASERFRATLSWLTNELADTIRVTKFKSRAWFYSLAVATTDALSGIPQAIGPQPVRSSADIRARMVELDTTLKTTELRDLPSGLTDLQEALSRATSHVPQRKVRHEFFFGMLTFPDRQWRAMWEDFRPTLS